LCSIFKLNAQSLPVSCAGSWDRYVATPDPIFTNSNFTWFINGADSIRYYGAGNDSIKIKWGNKSGIDSVGVMETSEYGCQGDTSWFVVQVKGAVVNIGADKQFCFGDSVHFNAGSGYKSYIWNNDTSQKSQTYNAIAKQTDTVSVVAVNSDNCPATSSAIVTVYPLPIVSITYNGAHFNDTSICDNQNIQLDAGTGGVMYNWNTGDYSESIVVQASMSTAFYKVTVSNTYGDLTCSASDSVTIEPCSIFLGNNIPTAFTPNGDGQNDTWVIPGLEYAANASVNVYDRWGRLVYHSEHGYQPWNGKYNGKYVPMDNYFYIIKVDNNSKAVVGSIMVIR
jgi:gliding motility-associated-like protein